MSNDDQPLSKPGASRWREAQRAMDERNDKARKTAQAERAAHEQRIERERIERERGRVYR
jgi:hypothetical protein